MLHKFGNEMVECDEVIKLSWGPTLLIKRPPMDERTPEIKAANRKQIMSVCDAIIRKQGT